MNNSFNSDDGLSKDGALMKYRTAYITSVIDALLTYAGKHSCEFTEGVKAQVEAIYSHSPLFNPYNDYDYAFDAFEHGADFVKKHFWRFVNVHY